MLRWLKTVVVSDEEKASKRRQVGAGKTTTVQASKDLRWHRNRDVLRIPGRAWREPADWPGGARCLGGVSPVCGSRAERVKACSETAADQQVARGSAEGREESPSART